MIFLYIYLITVLTGFFLLPSYGAWWGRGHILTFGHGIKKLKKLTKKEFDQRRLWPLNWWHYDWFDETYYADEDFIPLNALPYICAIFVVFWPLVILYYIGRPLYKIAKKILHRVINYLKYPGEVLGRRAEIKLYEKEDLKIISELNTKLYDF